MLSTATLDTPLTPTPSLFIAHTRTSPVEPRDASMQEDVGARPPDSDSRRAAWERGPIISDLERRQYQFEGGGAASERQVGKHSGWLSRLFRGA